MLNLLYLRPDEDLAGLFSLFLVEATDPLLLVLLDELCDLTAALLLGFEPDERCGLAVASLLLEEEDVLLLLLTLTFRFLLVCCCATFLEEPPFDERELFISRVALLLRAGVFLLLSGRLFIASRFEFPALLVVAFLFTSLLRVPELTVPLVAEELLVAGLAFPDLETFPLPLLLAFLGV